MLQIRYEDLVEDLEKVSSDLENFTNGDFCFDLDKKSMIQKKETVDRSVIQYFLTDGCDAGISPELLV